MKFDALVKLYEAKQNGPPYIDYGDGEDDVTGNVSYYKDPEHQILHRLDGPAIEGDFGYTEWYKDGERHNLKGPAYTDVNGQVKEWYINGKQYTKKGFDEYKKKLKVAKEIQSHKNNRIDPGMLEDYL